MRSGKCVPLTLTPQLSFNRCFYDKTNCFRKSLGWTLKFTAGRAQCVARFCKARFVAEALPKVFDSLLFLALLFVCSFGSTLLLPATHGRIP
jgi:hypothetical protein